jgi:hypothetical protein
MSGAAALSAAKNRRGNSQQSQPTPNRNKIVSPAKHTSEPPKLMHPLQALQLHEIRLNQMEKLNTEFQDSIKSLSVDNVVTSHLREMNKRLLQLEEMFHHLKEDIFRIQTFTMETNMSFLKFKAETNSNGIVSASPEDFPANVAEIIIK